MTESVHDWIMWSADVPDETVLMQKLALVPDLRIIKIDRLFVDIHGSGVIERLREAGYLVFYDAKNIEIGVKLEALARNQLKRRPWMLNCMAGALSTGLFRGDIPQNEKDGLKRFAEACLEVGTRPCIVTVLTNKTERIVEQEFHGRSSIDQVFFYADAAIQAGFTDMVCSVHELDDLRRNGYLNDIDANPAGLRLPGNEVRDQARVGTPAAAKAAGAKRGVIGSSLTDGDIAANYAAIVANLKAA